MPLAEAGRSALQKLAAVMAAGSRERAAQLLSHIRVVQEPAGPSTEVWNVVQQALSDSVAVTLTYVDGQGGQTMRVVEPAGLLGTANGWYLAGWCRLRQAPRVFRLDRIALAAPTREAITPRSLDSVLTDIPFSLTQPTLV
jgi:predicted DNA-binding transcriptional regulator YafY